MKKVTKVSRDKVKSFDFKKKPHTPGFLFPVAREIISKPVLNGRNFKLTKTNMESVNGPYLMLVTHSSMIDFMVMTVAVQPYRANNVMTLEGFNTYTEPLMRSLGVLGTRKYISDLNLIKNIRYCIEKLENPFVLFPEARYSLDGCTSYIPESTAKLVRMLRVPVVVLRIHGNFVTQPQWNKIDKGNHIEAEMIQIITPQECKKLSVPEIDARIKEAFQYDDFKWQYEKKIKIDHPKRAEGLHALLYKCPACQTEGETYSEGTKLWCQHCGKEWEMDEYGRMHALEGETEFPHIPDWSNWERECVRKEIEDGTYYFEDTVQIDTLPGSLKFYHQGEGKLIQTPTETRIECNYHGEAYTLTRSAMNLESMHIEYDYLGRGDCVDISIPDDSFWCYLSKRDAITKISFATEEMHLLAVRKAEEARLASEKEKEEK
ncbi:MAG: hypothetical protein IJ455_05305 [Agathobacter sp.]|nr:hypothetical protein [Agathobacter sp.]